MFLWSCVTQRNKVHQAFIYAFIFAFRGIVDSKKITERFQIYPLSEDGRTT